MTKPELQDIGKLRPLGFDLFCDFMNEEAERIMIAEVRRDLDEFGVPMPDRNRVIRYGWDYDRNKLVRPTPEWLAPMLDQTGFNSITVNEYLPGQSIGLHMDSKWFGPRISVINLAADCVLLLEAPTNSDSEAVVIPRRSFYVLSGEIRSKWLHGTMPSTQTRYSIVFRQRMLSRG